MILVSFEVASLGVWPAWGWITLAELAWAYLIQGGNLSGLPPASAYSVFCRTTSPLGGRGCQPIKYVLFGFAKRTGSFGPIGRSTAALKYFACLTSVF